MFFMIDFLNIFLKLNQQRFEGTILMIVIVIFTITILIWYFFVSKPKEKKAFDNWLNVSKDKLALKAEIKNILNQISKQITPCNKCKNSVFQIWDLSSSINLRCLSCKKKIEFEIKNIDEIKFVFDLYITLFFEKLNTNNMLVQKYISNNIGWNFESVRKGNSLYSVFEINAVKELEENSSLDSMSYSRRISQKVKDQVWNRDQGKCVECGSKEKLEFDHIIPFSKGGSNTYRNIQLLCENCNRTKSNKIG